MPKKPKVVFPLYDGSTLLDFAGATQIFAFAGFEPVWAAASLGPVTTTENVQVLPGDTFEGVPVMDGHISFEASADACTITAAPAGLEVVREPRRPTA